MTTRVVVTAGLILGLLGLGCGSAVDGDDGAEPDACNEGDIGCAEGDNETISAEDGEQGADADPDEDGSEGKQGGGAAITVHIKCGGHFPLCPQGRKCVPVRQIEGEVGYGYCL